MHATSTPRSHSQISTGIATCARARNNAASKGATPSRQKHIASRAARCPRRQLHRPALRQAIAARSTKHTRCSLYMPARSFYRHVTARGDCIACLDLYVLAGNSNTAAKHARSSSDS